MPFGWCAALPPARAPRGRYQAVPQESSILPPNISQTTNSVEVGGQLTRDKRAGLYGRPPGGHRRPLPVLLALVPPIPPVPLLPEGVPGPSRLGLAPPGGEGGG
eukprot:1238932-Pyramimonas_sp.AAC.1